MSEEAEKQLDEMLNKQKEDETKAKKNGTWKEVSAPLLLVLVMDLSN